MLNKYIFLGILAIISISLVSSHLDGGEDIQSGNYLIDFGYSPEVLLTDSPSTLSFQIYDADRRNANPEEMNLKIMKGEDVIYEETITPENGQFLIVRNFEEAGHYTLEAEFFKEGEDIAHHEFEIRVNKKVEPELQKYTSLFGVVPFYVELLIIILLIIGIIILRRIEMKKK